MRRRKTWLAALAAVAAGACCMALAAPPAPASKDKPKKDQVQAALKRLSMKNARLRIRPGQLSELLARGENLKGKLGGNQEKLKGAAQKLYPQVAPAVVLVLTDEAHGTGFLVGKDGWIVTNHHVIAGAAPDPKTGALQASIFLGKLDADGVMQSLPQSVPALVYKDDPVKDLALLKLSAKPEGVTDLPVLRLAAKAPKPGSDCVAIGQPAAGTLWTVRSGVVAGYGTWPKDMTDFIVERLALKSKDDQKVAEDELDKMDAKKVLVSSIGSNPGDSGGPLVDEHGEVVGVTYAGPSDVGLDKVSYHIHLDELRDFLADIDRQPDVPPPNVPDPTPPGVYVKLIDLDFDGVPDALAYGFDENSPPNGVLIDLLHVSPKLTDDDLSDPDKVASWKYQAAVHYFPRSRAFYDADGAGRVNLILTDVDGDGTADYALTLADGKWAVGPADGRPVVDPAAFADEKVQNRLKLVWDLLQKQ